jgi:hypothetical protein
MIWIARRKVRGTVKALYRHYQQGRAKYPDVDMPSLCQEVIGFRYKILKPNEAENAVIQKGISKVSDIYEAAVLVVLAEYYQALEDWQLRCALIEATVLEVAKREGVKKPADDPTTLYKMADIMKNTSGLF